MASGLENSVYQPLHDHLLFSGSNQVSMTFAEVEVVLGRPLPASARKRTAWWSNNAEGHVQALAWLSASYRTAELDLAAERVTFVLDLPYGGGLMDAKQSIYRAAGAQPPLEVIPEPGVRCHPAFGSLRGTTIVMPGYDLTAPTVLLMGETGDA
ncbi:MAG TPA: hypothetical protein VGD86_02915 [Devosia sp.]|jgi:hypothetical protein